MGNAIGIRSKKAKVMKIDGETFKLKTPAVANDVVKDYPGHVLLDSQAVKHFGLRAKPLDPDQSLKPNKIYFLVELPKVKPEVESDGLPRRVRSSGVRGINAKERLELLALSKRSASDLTLVRPEAGLNGGPTRVRMRLPKAQLEKLIEESNNDGAEVAEKIMNMYMAGAGAGAAAEDGGVKVAQHQHNNNNKPRGKRVSFSPIQNEEIINAEETTLQ
ncbi:uncharacterized protein At1g66480 [Arachis duranensis]|uniref:Uncharacterized protein At1g66480 n=1 Tax=Arachis duranensis TaxID=130453 RepID=A0A6P4BJM7_ARADU|nr:uncharacterized protein At1g66480 [Arachis duranensis]